MLASLLLISSLIIGLCISLVELQSELNDHRNEFYEKSESVFKLSVGAATNAAWSLDPRLAREVVEGIISTAGVISVEIQADLRHGDHQRLFYLESPALKSDSFTRWIAQKLFLEDSRISRQLTLEEHGQAMVVGMLTIEFDPQHVAAKYIGSTYSIVIFSLLESFLIGLLLWLVTRWLLTAPLRRAARVVAQIGPEVLQKDNYSVPVPDIHDSNELGQLLHHTNQLIERLTNSQVELRRLATRDPLTGMANRMLIKEQLVNMLAQAARTSRMVGVIFLDLDRFKTINDSLGHDIGDILLKSVASTLLQEIRQQDAVGRLGGDEFLFLVPANELGDVVVLANRIIEALAKPYAIEGYEIRTNASLGIAMYPENGEDADTLMRSADLAMYRAKSDGANRWHLYSEDMREVLDETLALETALIGAIDRNEMALHLQPQFHTVDGKLAGCEALLRWKYKGNWIAPYEFIKIAENTGMILEIGDWVIGETCRILKRWADQAVSISVNVSGGQLGDANFVSRLFAMVRKYNIDPELIELEITETMLMENLENCIERLTELRSAGFKISIDDFGTGYSSLAYLTRLPIDELKIDRSFVSGSQRSTVVLNTIIAMGRALNLLVVAEGVETEQQRTELVDSGCDLLQGYL
ncbi:MAG: putative bifunctional diguanylate cyclase/phosphodiesterase, partial [Planctomycetota bacterium]